jgi:hypothetical protein
VGQRILMPLAIQLTRREDGMLNTIYTPPPLHDKKTDKEVDQTYTQAGLVWMFAKMHVQCSDSQVVYHFSFSLVDSSLDE